MKSSSETLQLSQPLRDLLCQRVTTRADEEIARRQLELADAFERGRIDGEKRLSHQLLQQRTDLLDLQNGVLQSLQQTLPALARQSEQALVQLALEVARKVVSNIPVSAEIIEAAIREALAQVQETSGLIVQLNPADLTLLQNVHSPLLLPSSQPDLKMEPNPDISRGGCRIKTRFGIIDAQRETKWNQLQQAFTR